MLVFLYKILYNISVKNIFDILTSRAKIMILRTLHFQEEAIPLRHLSLISGLPIFSVQNAIDPLLDEAIINRIEKDNNVLFALNEKHPLYKILEQFFTIEMNNRIYLEAKLFYQKARQVLEFAASANIVFKRAKLRRNFR